MTEPLSDAGEPRYLQRLVRLVGFRKQWFVVWGGAWWTCKPRKELRWTFCNDPLGSFAGCGPFADDKIDDALAEFVPNPEITNAAPTQPPNT